MGRMRGARDGFTLIEVLIALVVLSVALAGMIPVVVHSARGNSFGKDMTEAATLAQDKLEECKRMDADHLRAAVATAPPDETAIGTNGAFTRQWRVINSGAGTLYNDDLFGIEVKVSWTDAQGGHAATAFTVRADFQ